MKTKLGSLGLATIISMLIHMGGIGCGTNSSQGPVRIGASLDTTLPLLGGAIPPTPPADQATTDPDPVPNTPPILPALLHQHEWLRTQSRNGAMLSGPTFIPDPPLSNDNNAYLDTPYSGGGYSTHVETFGYVDADQQIPISALCNDAGYISLNNNNLTPIWSRGTINVTAPFLMGWNKIGVTCVTGKNLIGSSQVIFLGMRMGDSVQQMTADANEMARIAGPVNFTR